MKKFIILTVVLLCYSCIAQDTHKFISKNEFVRFQLKKMKFKESFKNEMSKNIDENSVYFNFYQDLEINYKVYGYWRFFKTGQYAAFRSKENNVDLNDLSKAMVIGYYNVEGNFILIEIPNISFRKAGKREILKFEILEDGIRQIEPNTNKLYKKTYINDLKSVVPNW